MAIDTTVLGYPLFDADNHYYEPYDVCTRHIEARYKDRAVRVEKGADGLGRLYYGANRFGFMRVIQTDYIGAPGSLQSFFADGAAGVERQIINGHDHPATMHKPDRLRLMDEQGIEAAFLLPTMLDGIEHEMSADPEALYVNFRAYNRWVEEDWGFGDDGRIFGAGIMSLVDIEMAVAELERLLASGVRVIHLMPRPIYGRSPAHPDFDPFWARVEEAALPVIFHVGDSGYNSMVSTLWGEGAHPAMQNQSAFQWFIGSPERAITDTLASLVLHNLFGRFPALRILSIENGSAWMPDLLKSMDKAVLMAGDGAHWLGGKIQDKPADILREHLWIAPFFEEDCVRLVKVMGTDHVLFGSDYPHPEGLLNPVDFAEPLTSLPAEDIRKVMRGNAAGLMGLPE